jgi:hypothetical protein
MQGPFWQAASPSQNMPLASLSRSCLHRRGRPYRLALRLCLGDAFQTTIPFSRSRALCSARDEMPPALYRQTGRRWPSKCGHWSEDECPASSMPALPASQSGRREFGFIVHRSFSRGLQLTVLHLIWRADRRRTCWAYGDAERESRERYEYVCNNVLCGKGFR